MVLRFTMFHNVFILDIWFNVGLTLFRADLCQKASCGDGSGEASGEELVQVRGVDLASDGDDLADSGSFSPFI